MPIIVKILKNDSQKLLDLHHLHPIFTLVFACFFRGFYVDGEDGEDKSEFSYICDSGLVLY